jgi:hypothetical protein
MVGQKGVEWTMGCCMSCGAPIKPTLEAFRRDSVAIRALLYIASEAERNKADWNIGAEPKVLDEYNGLHIFHATNTIPVMQLFSNGNAKDLWLTHNTPHYNRHNFKNPPPTKVSEIKTTPGSDLNPTINSFRDKADVPADMICVATTAETNYYAVSWGKPKALKDFKDLRDLVVSCVNNVGFCRETPDFKLIVPGCKSCNDIMTLESTSAHFLVRDEIHADPLVPLESILSIKLTGSLKQDNLLFAAGDSKYRWDPNEANKGGHARDFTYQACLAYYVHRCMPSNVTFSGSINGALRTQCKKMVHTIITGLAFLCLEIAGLMYERYNGLQGGKERLNKAAYRYRGCTELYVSYVLWMLLRIDNVDHEDEGNDGKHCTLDFVQFHRFIFSDVLKVLVLAEPRYAGEIEILDIVFKGDLLKSGRTWNILSGYDNSHPPEERIGYVANSLAAFYKETVKPIFSRHMAGLEPDPRLIPNDYDGDDDDDDAIKHNKQTITYNMIIDNGSIDRVVHKMFKAIVGQIDTFITQVGIHAVLGRWQTMLELAPSSTEKLVTSFVDTEVLQEYNNIRVSMRPDAFQPMISPEAAETIYTMCNALVLTSEPSTKEELELLKISPMCSEMKSIERLEQVGAFVVADDVQT